MLHLFQVFLLLAFSFLVNDDFLRDNLKLTIVMVSHDFESLKKTSDRIAFVGRGKILSVEPIAQLMKNSDPLIADYFSNL